MEDPEAADPTAGQTRRVESESDIERALMSMVGDLATYRPSGKVVVFEGEDSEFDVRLVQILFPDFARKVNLISGGSKRRVRELHNLLERAVKSSVTSRRFFAVTDRDDDEVGNAMPKVFRWDVYHIENYLFDRLDLVQATLTDLTMGACVIKSEHELDLALRTCATTTIEGLVSHSTRMALNARLVKRFNLGGGNRSTSELFSAATDSVKAMSQALSNELSLTALEADAKQLRESLERSIGDGTWRSKLRGRDILKALVHQHAQRVGYEAVRNGIVARMRDAGFQPVGMKSVLDAILSA